MKSGVVVVVLHALQATPSWERIRLEIGNRWFFNARDRYIGGGDRSQKVLGGCGKMLRDVSSLEFEARSWGGRRLAFAV